MRGCWPPNKTLSILPGIVFAAIILYVIAWNVTDVKLDRLVERFGDARVVATNLFNPDVVTIIINGEDQDLRLEMPLHVSSVTNWPGGHRQGLIRVSDNLLDIIGRVKAHARCKMADQPGAGRARQRRSTHSSPAPWSKPLPWV